MNDQQLSGLVWMEQENEGWKASGRTGSTIWRHLSKTWKHPNQMPAYAGPLAQACDYTTLDGEGHTKLAARGGKGGKGDGAGARSTFNHICNL